MPNDFGGGLQGGLLLSLYLAVKHLYSPLGTKAILGRVLLLAQLYHFVVRDNVLIEGSICLKWKSLRFQLRIDFV